MFIYHTTTKAAAESILESEFRSCEAVYLAGRLWRGVWFADRPVDGHAGIKGDTVLVIEIPEGLFDRYQWSQRGRTYRESLIPSETINRYGSPRIFQDDEFSQMRAGGENQMAVAKLIPSPIDLPVLPRC